MVPALINMFRDSLNIRSPYAPPNNQTLVSIVICSFGRPELNETLQSLSMQTFKNFEVILITDKGHLSKLRQLGLEKSVGEITCFIDDDVICPKTWLAGVVEGFHKDGVVGISGPTTVPRTHLSNRDIFKFKSIKRFYDWLFVGSSRGKPGAISDCGAVSTASNYEISGCYEGPVGYLEACNMSVKTKKAKEVGGFYSIYKETSEWCEVDLSLKLREKGILWYSKNAGLFHKPSQSGVYTARLKTKHRWDNFIVFQKRWTKPSIKTYLYRSFVWLYFKIKQMGIV